MGRRWLALGLFGLLGLCLVTAVLAALLRGRATADLARCQDHLRQIGLQGLGYASLPGEAAPKERRASFPAATVVRDGVPPEGRLSWYAVVLPPIDVGSGLDVAKRRTPRRFDGIFESLDATKDYADNRAAARVRLTLALCPTRPATAAEGEPARGNYVLSAGLGLDAARRTLDAAGRDAGLFRFDEATPLAAVADGLSTTIAILETSADPGPWLQGGPATARGLDPKAVPYLGRGAPFGGTHLGKTYCGFADASVRAVTETVDPAVFRALLTIRGGEAAELQQDE